VRYVAFFYTDRASGAAEPTLPAEAYFTAAPGSWSYHCAVRQVQRLLVEPDFGCGRDSVDGR
jgi:hypothetical protein